MSRTPASFSLTVVRGATWEDDFTYTNPDGSPFDLTGYQARMQVRTLAGQFGLTQADMRWCGPRPCCWQLCGDDWACRTCKGPRGRRSGPFSGLGHSQARKTSVLPHDCLSDDHCLRTKSGSARSRTKTS